MEKDKDGKYVVKVNLLGVNSSSYIMFGALTAFLIGNFLARRYL